MKPIKTETMKICRSSQTGKYLRALLGYEIGTGYNPTNNTGEVAWFEKKQTGLPVVNVNHTMALMVKDLNAFDPR